jgi:serine palmitoyltransferase
VLVLFIVWLVFRKKPKRQSDLTPADVDDLIKEWRPQPLVPALTDANKAALAREIVVEKYVGSNEVVVKGSRSPKLNLLSFDFLGMGSRKELKAAAKATLEEYGCGSCGPRGFYGSVMPHLEVEDAVAAFVGTPAGISYVTTTTLVQYTIQIQETIEIRWS